MDTNNDNHYGFALIGADANNEEIKNILQLIESKELRNDWEKVCTYSD